MIIPAQYRLISEAEITESRSRAFELEHIRTGAKLLVLENEDPNKVFSIAFRTPVSDSTGVPHILEHSVLCGSDKYPVKDPFMSLAKGSLNTFLNAMTYPDKTIYPVASCNLQDFKNLMSVYMDAVLRPRIYRYKEIFMQEGWHYELEDPSEPLSVNGVVYNEMKGAFSDPDELIDRYCLNSLFPDTGYGYVSGGDPEVIPSLDYEQFIDFHSRYYHPSNSYIYLYGDCDMAERLIWLDCEYLGKYERLEIDSSIKKQEPFTAAVYKEIAYPANDGAQEMGGYISTQWAIGEITDVFLEISMEVVENVILLNEGAPLKQALLDGGLCLDVLGGYQSYTRQPYFSVIAKGIAEDRREEFNEIVDKTLAEIVKNGIKKRSIYATINRIEFNLKEWQGSMPRGLNYNLAALDTWLYGGSPYGFLKYNDLIAFVKEKAETDYFEQLIRTCLINNTHKSTIVLKASTTLGAEREEQLAGRLADYKASLCKADIEAIIAQTKALRKFQETEDAPGDIAALPCLSLSEINRDITPQSTKRYELNGIPVLHHETDTYGISYMSILYELDCVKPSELPLIGILKNVLTMLSTENFGYSELCDEIDLYTGGIVVAAVSAERADTGEYYPKLRIGTKFMRGSFEKAYELIKEILYKTDFSDIKRLADIMKLLYSKAEAAFNGASHSAAYGRALSYAGGADKYGEYTDGIDFVEFIKGYINAGEAKLKQLGEKLKELAARIFVPETMTISIIEDKENFDKLCNKLRGEFGQTFHREPAPGPAFAEDKKREAFVTAGQVNYAAVAGSFKKAGLPYTGALQVLRNILSTEYLWNTLRVLGGAYGAMCGFSRLGYGYFVSYRDPHLARSYKAYTEAAEYIESLELSDKQMSEYIIGTIGSLDRPMSPFAWGHASLVNYLAGISNEQRQHERDEVLSCTSKTINSLAGYISAIAGSGMICTVGTAAKIEEHKDMFGEIRMLF